MVRAAPDVYIKIFCFGTGVLDRVSKNTGQKASVFSIARKVGNVMLYIYPELNISHTLTCEVDLLWNKGKHIALILNGKMKSLMGISQVFLFTNFNT